MVSNLRNCQCEFYNRRSRVCTLDGSSWCAFPKSNYCDLAASEHAKKKNIPSVILEIQEDVTG